MLSSGFFCSSLLLSLASFELYASVFLGCSYFSCLPLRRVIVLTCLFGFFAVLLENDPCGFWLVQQPSGSSVLSEHVWILLCSFGIVLCCLQVALQLLPSLLSYLFIVGIVVIVAVAVAESSFSC